MPDQTSIAVGAVCVCVEHQGWLMQIRTRMAHSMPALQKMISRTHQGQSQAATELWKLLHTQVHWLPAAGRWILQTWLGSWLYKKAPEITSIIDYHGNWLMSKKRCFVHRAWYAHASSLETSCSMLIAALRSEVRSKLTITKVTRTAILSTCQKNQELNITSRIYRTCIQIQIRR